MSFRSRFRRGNALRPVNRIKHVVDKQAGVSLGTNNTTFLADAKDAPVLGNPAEVQTGCTINGIFLVVEVYARTASALANVYMTVVKNPGGNITLPTPNTVGTSDDKRYVIHQEMVMLNRQIDGNPRTLFKGVIVLPRGYRRFGPGDQLTLQIRPPGVDIDLCIQCHYKEFR